MGNRSTLMSYSAANGIDIFLYLFVKLISTLTRHGAFSVSNENVRKTV